MCGICGMAPSRPDESPAADVLRAMAESLRHRGPDGEGFYQAPGIGLGVRRLAIIDLETGDQPIANEDGTLTMVCNGEIYNFAELRAGLSARGHRFRSRSDVEVIVHLYEEHGVKCVEHLRGMFAFALWDGRQRRLMLARDRLGIKPMYYALAAGRLYFGSEQKALLAAGATDRELDLEALDDLITFGFVVGPRTLFTRIRQLLPAHYLVYQGGALSTHRYWDLSFPRDASERPRVRAEAWAEELRDTLERSVRLHLASDVPIGAWLSGGIDSSAVVALMSRLTQAPVSTFSLAFEGQDNDEVTRHRTLDRFPGYALARHDVACGASDLDYLPDAVWHAESPAALGLTLPRLILSRSTAQRVKVVLTGEGSDELLGGYPWFRMDRIARRVSGWPLFLRRLAASTARRLGRGRGAVRLLAMPRGTGPAWYANLVGPACGTLPAGLLSRDLRRRLAEAGPRQEAWTDPAAWSSWHPAHQLHYHDTTVFLPNYVVHALDRASMGGSLEARVPFLDHEVVELCARIPPSLVMRGAEEKHILRQALSGILPPEIVRRRKRPFIAPIEGWLRGPLPERFEHLLSPESLRAKGYFDADGVTAMLARHRAGLDRHGRSVLTVLGLQLWDELFIQGRGQPTS